MQKGNVRDYETEFMDKDGARYICSLNIELIKNPGGKPEKIVGIFRDISERKKNELERIEAQKIADEHEKLALVGRIAGKMAHDFNNVLGIIMGNTELSLLHCEEPRTKKTLNLIYEQTLRGKNLTKNLVAFSKDQEPKQEFFTIHEKMDLVISLLKKDLEGINVIREYNHGTPELLADPGMIEHAMVNLIQNSIHATSLTSLPEIIIRTTHRDGMILIEIEDNGCGIPQELIGEIFEPSFTLKGSKDRNGFYKPGIKGTGYGMSNVKKYIEQHKGKISIFSELQKGTKIVISLPVIKKNLTAEEIEVVKKESFVSGKYILVVEDEQAIADIQYRILTHEPCLHKVDIACNGQVAIDLLGRNKYDFISLDYILPGTLNGMDVCHHIRKTDKTVPILFVSGNIDFLESIKDLKQKDPYIDHLSKPCKNIDYISTINRLFGSALM
jgi:signal transduction histidine kinase/CheY-like chemotaxis protein